LEFLENSSNLVKLRIHLPNSCKVERQFQCDDKVEQIFYFVENQELRNVKGDLIENWELISTFPDVKKYHNPHLTLKEAGITHAMKLIVQEVF